MVVPVPSDSKQATSWCVQLYTRVCGKYKNAFTGWSKKSISGFV